MANSASSLKRARQNPKRRAQNKIYRSRIRTYTNYFEEALESGDVEKAEAAFRDVESTLMRAAIKGIIPKSRASRRTGRMAKRLHALR